MFKLKRVSYIPKAILSYPWVFNDYVTGNVCKCVVFPYWPMLIYIIIILNRKPARRKNILIVNINDS